MTPALASRFFTTEPLGKLKKLSGASLIRAPISFRKGSTLMTPQWSCVPIPSLWGLGFEFWGDTNIQTILAGYEQRKERVVKASRQRGHDTGTEGKTAWWSQWGLDNGRVKHQVGSHMRWKTGQDQGQVMSDCVMSDFVPQIDTGGWIEGKGATAATTGGMLFQ